MIKGEAPNMLPIRNNNKFLNELLRIANTKKKVKEKDSKNNSP